MHKGIKITVLQLESELELGVFSAHRAKLPDHFKAVCHIPHMVISHFENK
jgi:hypothetical protein